MEAKLDANSKAYSSRWIRRGSSAASPRHKAACNHGRRPSARKNESRGLPRPRPWLDSRTSNIQTSRSDPRETSILVTLLSGKPHKKGAPNRDAPKYTRIIESIKRQSREQEKSLAKNLDTMGEGVGESFSSALGEHPSQSAPARVCSLTISFPVFGSTRMFKCSASSV